MNKKTLAIILSKLERSNTRKISLEQYHTDYEIAADILWMAYQNKDIEKKIIGDLGCGNGILGIGALILGARKVIFLDIDRDNISLARENIKTIEDEFNKKFDFEILSQDIVEFNNKIEVVIQNPPFGVKKEHADRIFLIAAMKNADTIYSLHKVESKGFIKKLADDNGFKVEFFKEYKFPIRKSEKFHKKKVYYVDVGLWKLAKLF